MWLAAVLAGCVDRAEPAIGSWLGLTMTLEAGPIQVEGRTFQIGLRVRHVMTGAPAYRAGLGNGDVIVGAEGISFEGPREQLMKHFDDSVRACPAGSKLKLLVVRDWVSRSAALDGRTVDPPGEPEAWMRSQAPGAKLEMELRRERKLVEVEAELQPRPVILPRKRETEFPEVAVSLQRRLAEGLLQETGRTADWMDLNRRMRSRFGGGDVFRLAGFAADVAHPLELVEHGLAIGRAVSGSPPAQLLSEAASRLSLESEAGPPPAERLSFEDLCNLLRRILDEASNQLNRAFRRLSKDDQAFLMGQLDRLGAALVETTYLQTDTDSKRLDDNLRLIQMLGSVDWAALIRAAGLVTSLADPKELVAIENGLRAEWEKRGKPEGIFHTIETAYGKILFSGAGSTWFREDAAAIIDLGGDDFYTSNAGASRPGIPAAIVIDFGGNDAYEASFDWAQGAGKMGVGMLVDVRGNDSYIGQRFAQGACAAGIGMLIDMDGRDTYRAAEFAQGAALWGVAGLWEGGGDDRYEAARFAQGFGCTMGFGALSDAAGNDSYYCKGRQQTSFGDRGIFEGWGQGCGMGIRGVSSGGIGVLADGSGNDVYEGGNYTQGGGFYFGLGILFDVFGDDRYTASRWGQAFAAHQALGVLIDQYGNDTYLIRQGGGQSMAWEESATALVDVDGDDHYVGGRFFCQAAACHNSVAFFNDKGGADHYEFAAAPGATGPNDYHGGKSLSLFVDEGGGEDRYERGENNAIVATDGHGFFADLPGSLGGALRDGAFRKLLR